MGVFLKNGAYIEMTNNEVELLTKYLNQTKIYLEWGLGGSTILACQSQKIESVYSIENDKKWIKKWKKDNKNLVDINKVNIVYINTGKTTTWGYPINQSKFKISAFKQYTHPRKLININPDTILIDGRCRVECAINCLLLFKPKYVLIHDFQREYYQEVLKFFDKVEMKDTLVVLSVKNKLNLKVFQELNDFMKKDTVDLR